MRPALGATVIYFLIDGGRTVPAIVANVLDGEHVDLFVMSPHATVGGSIPSTGHFERNVPAGTTPGHWCAPKM